MGIGHRESGIGNRESGIGLCLVMQIGEEEPPSIWQLTGEKTVGGF
ncbi:hypothetical protein QT970_25960 [Microcoleus sp. herbarium8]